MTASRMVGSWAARMVASRAEPKAARWDGATAGLLVVTMAGQRGAHLAACWAEK